jgi:predicted transcriptional regulator
MPCSVETRSMPRKTADERHRDSAPENTEWPPKNEAMIDALIAVHNPTRRRLLELLSLEGPASVGRLAQLSGTAVGSVSHHLKRLHKAGFIEPAPEHAHDTRESWWQAIPRRFSWTQYDFPAGSGARDIADAAERAEIDHQLHAMADWLKHRAELPEPWDTTDWSSSGITSVTTAQVRDLTQRLQHVIDDWSSECRADRQDHPDADRMPVRLMLRVFPHDPTDR